MASHLASHLGLRDCAIITWRGGSETRGGHRGKSQLEGGGLDVKLKLQGGITFFTLFHKLEKW